MNAVIDTRDSVSIHRLRFEEERTANRYFRAALWVPLLGPLLLAAVSLGLSRGVGGFPGHYSATWAPSADSVGVVVLYAWGLGLVPYGLFLLQARSQGLPETIAGWRKFLVSAPAIISLAVGGVVLVGALALGLGVRTALLTAVSMAGLGIGFGYLYALLIWFGWAAFRSRLRHAGLIVRS